MNQEDLTSTRRAHPQNSTGPFYVRNGECIACGAPESESPTMMSHDGEGHCYFARQPTTAEETNAAILSTWVSCCRAVRYGGQDREILIRLAEIGAAGSCDYRLENEPKQVQRNRVSFEFVQPETQTTRPFHAPQIMEYVASTLKNLGGGGGRVLALQSSRTELSFRYEWGGLRDVYCARFTLEPRPPHGWVLKIQRNDNHSTTAFSVIVHKALERDPRFQKVLWHAEADWQKGIVQGHLIPY